MNKNTALGASEVTKNIIFQGEMHKKFFLLYLPECRNEDVYHQALIYCLESVEIHENMWKKFMILKQDASKQNA